MALFYKLGLKRKDFSLKNNAFSNYDSVTYWSARIPQIDEYSKDYWPKMFYIINRAFSKYFFFFYLSVVTSSLSMYLR
jgi:hypothetical protein